MTNEAAENRRGPGYTERDRDMYPTIVLLGLMFLTWMAALWASWEDTGGDGEHLPDYDSGIK
jgi:hypothetical protein